jgi:diacylglycerol kinase family enzyme
MQTYYLVNPKAGSNTLARFERLKSQLPVGEIILGGNEQLYAQPPHPGDRLVSVGGDGTLNRLVNDLIAQVGIDRAKDFAVGHIGLGSNNSYLQPASACTRLNGVPVRISNLTASHDLGEVSYRMAGGEWQTCYFVANASFGFLAAANEVFNKDPLVARVKKWSSSVADVLAFVKTLRHFSPENPRVVTAGTESHVPITNLHIIKHAFYAADLHFIEEPGLNSGHFHIHWLDGLKRSQIAKRFLQIFAFKKMEQAHSGFNSSDTAEVYFDKPTAFEMDGEVVWGQEFKIRCRKGALTVCQ